MTMTEKGRLRRILSQILPDAAAATAPSDFLFRNPGKKVSNNTQEGSFGTYGKWDPKQNIHPMVWDPSEDAPGADKLGLSPEEIKQFKELGFVVKRGLIPKEDLRPLVDLWWQQFPIREAGMRRDDPSTWVAPGQKWPRQDRESSTARAGAGRIPHNLDRKQHYWRWHGIGHDPEFLRGTSQHPNMLHMIEAIRGGPVRMPKGNRGVYAVFPRAEEERTENQRRLGPHLDGVAGIEMVCAIYLEDVPARGGGYTIWPGSCQHFYPTSEQALNWVPTDLTKEAMNYVFKNIQPRELMGKAGDVLFTHGLTMHSAGIHEGDNLRLAVFCDVGKVRERGPLVCRAVGRNGGTGASLGIDGFFRLPEDPNDPAEDPTREVITAWHVDGLEWAKETHPPLADMWADWNLGKEPVKGDVLDEPKWFEKYGITISNGQRGEDGCPSPIGAPRGNGLPISAIATYEGNGIWRAKQKGNDWRSK